MRSLHSLLLVSVLALACSGVTPAPTFAAGAEPCIEAVFFDLGNTLIEDPGTGTFVLKPGAAETVQALKDRETQVGVITNVPAGWTRDDLENLMAQPEFLDEFDVLVLSSLAPAPKPDPAIYTFAHGQLPTAVPIGQTAFVGETLGEIANLETNPTEGARSVGMIGIHLSTDPPSPLADHTVAPDDLPAIVTIVQESCPVFTDGFESGDTDAWQ